MNKHFKQLMKVVTGFAWVILVWAANTTCIYCTYQDKAPEGLDRFKKR